MKTLLQGSSLAVTVMLASLQFSGCSDTDVQPKNDDDPTVVTSDEADALMESLSFVASEKITGTVPVVANTALTRMNGSDTIYVVQDVTMPIRISFPKDRPATGAYVNVDNSTYYYDAPVVPEDGSDTTGTVYVQINFKDETTMPKDFPVKVTPHDETGTPIDVIERIVEVEETTDPDCPITNFGWYWTSTTGFNYAGEITFENYPGKRFKTVARYEGCCAGGQNCPVLSTTLNAEVNAEILYIIMSETFSINAGGTFTRNTHEQKRNFDPTTTQWCSSDPGYTEDNEYVNYSGTHNFQPDVNKIAFTTTQISCDLCGFGAPSGGLIYSCHNMIIVSGSPSEGSTLIRVYKSRFTDQWSD